MKIIEKNKKYFAEEKEIDTSNYIKHCLTDAFDDIKNRLVSDVANHIGWTVGDYKWEYHLMEIALDDAWFEYKNLMSAYGGELTDTHRADIKNLLDCFISMMTTR